MWSFVELGPEDQIEKPKLDEFFNAQSPATSLVRESIQNSLDAKDNNRKTVEVHFTFRRVDRKILVKYSHSYDDFALPSHLQSNELGNYRFPDFESDSTALIVEDFNTQGLTGSTEKLNTDGPNNFRGFWWQVGISEKTKGLGSHGVGKTTLSGSSQAYSFLALTRRLDDDRQLLIGFSNLPYHMIESNHYRGYGRYGARNGLSFDPIEEASTIQQFQEDFKITRNQPGLSIVIPHVHNEIDIKSVHESVVQDYYIAIMNGSLFVKITDEQKDEQKDEQIILSQDTIKDYADDDPMLKFSAEALALKNGNGDRRRFFLGVEVDFSDQQRPKINKSSISEANLDLAKSFFANGDMVGMQVSMPIEHADNSIENSFVDLFLKSAPDTQNKRISQFVRNNIIVSKEKTGIISPYSFAMLIADDPAISNLLRLSEEPSHTNWYLGRLRKEKQYANDTPLRFVKICFKQLYNILSGVDDEEKEISGFASDIFWIDEPSKSKGKKKGSRKKGSKQSQEDSDDVARRRKPLVHIQKTPDEKGFSVQAVNGLDEIIAEEEINYPITCTVQAAYDIPGKNGFTNYSSYDFDFSKRRQIQIESQGHGTVVEAQGNRIIFQFESSDFIVNVNGFDGIRDLRVKCSTSHEDVEGSTT